MVISTNHPQVCREVFDSALNKQSIKNTLISLIAMEIGINVEIGIFWKKLVHNCNKRGVGGGKKSKKSINVEGGN